ncbi:hypothetical protein U14_00250 [Candidatus Moduliflexus flocculans]|uniref:Uncharacterized protein n=1 Tax=Candidatus Moduliflexus flocculans TaxID=1499966 RepID=A0A0S6VPI9_9BACT|nr:hypothetical protein U14_00250 [Candidatus Moduliflexus flocculans]
MIHVIPIGLKQIVSTWVETDRLYGDGANIALLNQLSRFDTLSAWRSLSVSKGTCHTSLRIVIWPYFP